jgi:hypothetical protein
MVRPDATQLNEHDNQIEKNLGLPPFFRYDIQKQCSTTYSAMNVLTTKFQNSQVVVVGDEIWTAPAGRLFESFRSQTLALVDRFTPAPIGCQSAHMPDESNNLTRGSSDPTGGPCLYLVTVAGGMFQVQALPLLLLIPF